MSKIILITLLCVALINAISAYYVAVDLGECPQACPDIYMPVCGTDGETYKEFPNACEMGVSNCQLEKDKLKPFVQTDYEWCSSTYPENIDETFNTLETERCTRICPLIYDPVCISNGEYRATINNECEIGFFNCLVESKENSKLFEVIKQGDC